MTTLATLMGYGKGHHKGEVGLEIETEALGGWDADQDVTKYWTLQADGSLRNVGVEFVFKKPYSPGTVEYTAALEAFRVQAARTKFIESVYTSVHVHLNMLDKQLVHMMNFITLYFLFEETLTKYCGAERDGNLFCLKTSNAEINYKTICDMAKAIEAGEGYNFIRKLDQNRLKYSGLNIAPLRNFGSLEVRTHPGTVDADLIDRWVSILMMLYKKATTFTSPVEIVNRLQGYRSHRAFADLIFEEYTQYLDLTDLTNQMKNGIWYATSLGHSVKNWKEFSNIKAKETLKKTVYDEDQLVEIDRAIRATNLAGTTRPTPVPQPRGNTTAWAVYDDPFRPEGDF